MKIKTKLTWINQESEFVKCEVDRTCCVAYAGRNPVFGFYRGKVSRFKIGWVKKIISKGSIKYMAVREFPDTYEHLFDTLPDAKAAVKSSFEWFVNMVAENN